MRIVNEGMAQSADALVDHLVSWGFENPYPHHKRFFTAYIKAPVPPDI